MKILIAADASPWTKPMISYVTGHRDWFGAGHEYTVFTVVRALPTHVAVMAEGGPDAIHRYYNKEAEKVFEPIRAAFAQVGIPARWEGRVGAPAEQIAEMAEAGKFDVVVMGARGHGAIGGLLAGSVSTKVLATCKVPVLLIR